VLIQNGTLHVGDYVAAGPLSGRVKVMRDFRKEYISVATPSMPATVLGFNEVPRAGMVIKAYASRKQAEEAAVDFAEGNKEASSGGRLLNVSRIKEMADSSRLKKLNLIIKADTKGSLEAIVQILEAIKGENVAVQILKTGVGNITETDISLAQSSDARIIGFNNTIEANAKKFAEKEKVIFRIFNIIYELAAYVKEELSSMLEEETVRTDLGKMKVIALFKLPKKSAKVVDMIFGAKVENGKAEKNAKLEIFRNGEKVGGGVLMELQHNKKAVSVLKSGNNAGVTFRGDVMLQESDDILVYKEEKVKRTLN
jgi:translation initiation factor IF-2